MALYPSSPDESGFLPVRIASPKSRNWRSNGASEMAMGSDAPDATSRSTGAGSPESFSTSHVVSLSPEITAVALVPLLFTRYGYTGQKTVDALNSSVEPDENFIKAVTTPSDSLFFSDPNFQYPKTSEIPPVS